MKEYTSESDDSILIEDIKISNILKKKNDRKKKNILYQFFFCRFC